MLGGTHIYVYLPVFTDTFHGDLSNTKGAETMGVSPPTGCPAALQPFFC